MMSTLFRRHILTLSAERAWAQTRLPRRWALGDRGEHLLVGEVGVLRALGAGDLLAGHRQLDLVDTEVDELPDREPHALGPVGELGDALDQRAAGDGDLGPVGEVARGRGCDRPRSRRGTRRRGVPWPRPRRGTWCSRSRCRSWRTRRRRGRCSSTGMVPRPSRSAELFQVKWVVARRTARTSACGHGRRSPARHPRARRRPCRPRRCGRPRRGRRRGRGRRRWSRGSTRCGTGPWTSGVSSSSR